MLEDLPKLIEEKKYQFAEGLLPKAKEFNDKTPDNEQRAIKLLKMWVDLASAKLDIEKEKPSPTPATLARLHQTMTISQEKLYHFFTYLIRQTTKTYYDIAEDFLKA